MSFSFPNHSEMQHLWEYSSLLGRKCLMRTDNTVFLLLVKLPNDLYTRIAKQVISLKPLNLEKKHELGKRGRTGWESCFLIESCRILENYSAQSVSSFLKYGYNINFIYYLWAYLRKYISKFLVNIS